MTNVSNSEDVLDSRDVIARIEELQEEIEEARGNVVIQTACRHCGLDIEGTTGEGEWRDRGNNTSCGASEERSHEPPEDIEKTHAVLPDDELTEEREELRALTALAEEASGYGDWNHGETLIRDSYFEDYAEQLAEDIGAIDRNAQWPLTHIDWKAAADALKQDYTSVDFDGVEYWIRSY